VVFIYTMAIAGPSFSWAEQGNKMYCTWAEWGVKCIALYFGDPDGERGREDG
jgi:hypothetical protein